LILIRGNHDVLPDRAYAPYVEAVIADGGGVELDVAGIDCWLTHYPTRSRPDRFNLVGHIHASWRLQRNMLNVGVDVQHFRPLSAAQVRMQYEIICNDYEGIYYDEDVWCSQHPANSAHEDRGILGSYFKD
jgi:calcineurin-like phosphoesterase family protein